MKITEFLDKKGIKIGIESTEKEDILKEMVDVLADVKDIGDKKGIVKALIDRENLGSTGIGQGIAIPHQISRLLRDVYFCELLRRCKTPDEVYELIRKEEEKKH